VPGGWLFDFGLGGGSLIVVNEKEIKTNRHIKNNFFIKF